MKSGIIKKASLAAAAILTGIALAGTTVFAAEAEDTDSSVYKEANENEPVELIVFAAASMTETMELIAEMYKEIAPYVTVVYNFDSSGTLKTQIEEGACCDLFISAAPKQMNALDASLDAENGNPEGLDFIITETRLNLLENKVVLAASENNTKEIIGFDDLVLRLNERNVLLSIGNSDVPVGQYTQKIFSYYNLNEEELAASGVITYGTNVKEVTTQVKEEAADCGIVYATDTFSAGLKILDEATSQMCGQVIYPAAVLNITENEEEAKAFLEFLQSEKASGIFESAGFTPIGKVSKDK